MIELLKTILLVAHILSPPKFWKSLKDSLFVYRGKYPHDKGRDMNKNWKWGKNWFKKWHIDSSDLKWSYERQQIDKGSKKHQWKMLTGKVKDSKDFLMYQL